MLYLDTFFLLSHIGENIRQVAGKWKHSSLNSRIVSVSFNIFDKENGFYTFGMQYANDTKPNAPHDPLLFATQDMTSYPTQPV